MSNRIRLLFHCDLDGASAHVGHKALLAMERLLRNPVRTQEWITHADWVGRKRPDYEKLRLSPNPNTGRIDKFYLMRASPPALDIKIPQLGSPIERAKWLWAHLPSEIRQHSRLIVARENRNNCWRRSGSNPRKYGWVKQQAKKPPSEYFKWSGIDIDTVEDVVMQTASEVFSGLHEKKAPPFQVQASEAKLKQAKQRFKTPPVPKAPVMGEEPKKPKLKVGIWS